MKSLLTAIASVIISVSANAQNSTVYYAPVTTNMEVGLGFDRKTNQCVLSIIEEASKAVDFNFNIINKKGESVLFSKPSEGYINVMPKDKTDNYYQCNYELSVPELMDILANAKDNIVVINGTQVSSKTFANAIENVQKELRPAPQAPTFQRRFRYHEDPWDTPRFGWYARR